MDSLLFSKDSEFRHLLTPADFKVYYGGRGGAKSWAIAEALVRIADSAKVLVLCARELQNSMSDSVHRLLVSQIDRLGMTSRFYITQTSIKSLRTNAEFIFKGLKHNATEIKSTEGVDICWVEEAQMVSEDSWAVLLPTIRKEGAEVWVSFNPGEESDATFQRFVVSPPPRSIVKKVSWRDNPYFSENLNRQRLHMLERDPEAYDWVWEGMPRKISEAAIFGRRIEIASFEAPPNTRFFYGADWGFANDPTALVRSYIQDECLFIDYEAFGIGVELDDLWKLFAGKTGATPDQMANWKPNDDVKYPGVPLSRDWPIKADSARPETISFMRRQGFNIEAAAKWPGSVEDGVEHLKGFKKIYIHQRCENMRQEARLYSYKVDKQSGDVLPIIVDKHNHGWDAVRYSLDGYIQSRGGTGVWARLAE